MCDSRGAVICSGRGLADGTVEEFLQLKESGKSLLEHPLGRAADLMAVAQEKADSSAIVVDCTAAAETTPALIAALEKGSSIVLANKKPLTQRQDLFDRLSCFADRGRWHPERSRWESTVGAGLPVIATLSRLESCGDRVESLSGSLSSTLGYLMSGLGLGRPFSRLVREVRRRGYVEPDPREDLSGIDVARKALILARTLGHRRELREVAVERLYPPAMDSLSVNEFMHQLPRLDSPLSARAGAAAAAGKVLRYVVDIGAQNCRVGVREVPLQSPLGQLAGTDQLIQIRSVRYSQSPLLIQGRGSGVEATADGVLSDIVDLARIRHNGQ